MKLFKYSLLLLVGISFASPKVFADNLDNVPLATLKQRMNHGDKDAMIKYYEKRFKVDGEKPLSEVEEMANRGDGVADAELGIAYLHGGRGIPQDLTKASEWFQKGVEVGDNYSLVNLGLLYLDGKGVTQDVSKAIELLTKAANNGVPIANLRLGLIYAFDKYGVQDYFKSNQWFEKAAQLGMPEAMLFLGMAYENGNGVVQDKAKAREYYKQACSNKLQKGCSLYSELNDQ